MAEGVTFIYALIDPRDQAVRYVGKTKQSLSNRLSQHCSDCTKYDRYRTHRAGWIRQLERLDMKPGIFLLEEVETELWEEAERYWIAHFHTQGARLTNATSGGGKETVHTPESRSKMSEAQLAVTARLSELGIEHWNKGRKRSAETRAKIGAAAKGRTSPNKGKKASPETLAKMSAAMKGRLGTNVGRKFSPEWIANMSAARRGNTFRKGKKATAETRARISEGHKGQRAWNTGVPMTAAARAHLSKLQKGKPGRNKGKKFSAQARANISAAQKKRWESPEEHTKMSAGQKAAWARRKAAVAPPLQPPLDL